MRTKKNILLVDADEQTLSTRTFLLETRGLRVLSAPNGYEAIQILERSAPDTLDLLIAELGMPGLDGNEVVRRAKTMHPRLTALITVNQPAEPLERALYSDAFLPKGADSSAELLQWVKLLTARKRGPKVRRTEDTRFSSSVVAPAAREARVA